MKKFVLLGKEIAGTILEEISNVSPEEIAILGKELEKLPVPEGIIVFGEMTELEKKIYVLIGKKEKMLREMIDADSGAAFFAKLGILSPNDADSEADSLNKTLLEIDYLENDAEFLRALVGFLLFGRLGLRILKISIRAGFKLTQVVGDKENREECTQSEKCAVCPIREFCPIA